ncbi:PQQ-dependent sugar dehydrogenase [Iamia sp. SCSIO 61187]|uniref:PQQ-dependent sugar dehydrogenase n=1 Tax=Iamia sp. SCSIO 61187 TaxID=2722752 RepID=UPI001C63AC48|nr:PQQ-dependent sugar dehydrogenase [Iamia sp. SCSIO 61187]QYG91693.1 PQQ-dependent sugar dehydrogenase [Iamia sp. SCSIO 61187]
MTGRRACALLGAALLVLALGACGDDEQTEPPERGAEVEGRAPTTPPTEDSTTTPATTGPSTTTGEAAPGLLGEVAVVLTPIVELDQPTKLVPRPGSDLLYVAEQGGRVVTVDPSTAPDAEVTTALDLTSVTRSGGEQGLLGLAFAPDGATLYVHHSGTDGETRIAAFTMDGAVADPGSRVDLLTVDQPYANHNGGELLVDEDGLLWIGLGDGGSGDDPDLRAQDPDDLLGKVLRIDPSSPEGDRPYGIPADNPYASDGGGRPEIALLGLRNPWRMRFDRATGDLWIADVGQNALEEIDRLPAGAILGANLGWSRFEGSDEKFPDRRLADGPLVGPVFEMAHADGWCSVSGGALYRGEAIPDLAGAYLFGDFCKPGLSAIRLDGDTVAETAVLDDAAATVVSVDTDAAGEVYVLSLDGVVARLDPA